MINNQIKLKALFYIGVILIVGLFAGLAALYFVLGALLESQV